MKNPQTVVEKVDAAANLVEQMYLAHMIRDEATFLSAHKRAGQLLHEATVQLDLNLPSSCDDDSLLPGD